MPRILLVDDVEGMREALKDVLVGAGYDVVAAKDGREAIGLATASAFDLVLTDVQMPDVDGVELLKWIKHNKPMPVVLMTAFSHIVETQKAFELGADEFLTKPFRPTEAVGTLQRVLKARSSKNDPSEGDAAYCRIPIEDFVSGSGLNVGVYVRLAEDRYVKVAHHGDLLPPDKAESYKRRGLGFLYVKRSDLASVVGFNLGLLRAISSNAVIPVAKKASFLRYTTETVLEQVYVNGIDRRAFALAKESVCLTLSLVEESDPLVELLDMLNSHANWIYAHSLGVSLYSAMIGRCMGWTSQANIFKLSLAGLLHDVGKKEIAAKILETPRSSLTREERSVYETHPIRSKEILGAFDGLPVDVLHVALEHRESHLGGGFPRAIPGFKIHPFAKIVNLADRFCYFAIKSPHSPGREAKEALAHLSLFESEFEPPVLAAFKKSIVPG